LNGVPLLGNLPLVVAEPLKGGLKLIRGTTGERGKVRIADQALDQPTVLIDPRGLDHGVPAKTASRRALIGEDPRKLIDDAARFAELAAAARKLSLDDVDPPLEQSAQVGQVGLFVFRFVAQLADLGQWQAGQSVEVAIREHSVDTAVTAWLGRLISVAVVGHVLPPWVVLPVAG